MIQEKECVYSQQLFILLNPETFILSQDFLIYIWND